MIPLVKNKCTDLYIGILSEKSLQTMLEEDLVPCSGEIK